MSGAPSELTLQARVWSSLSRQLDPDVWFLSPVRGREAFGAQLCYLPGGGTTPGHSTMARPQTTKKEDKKVSCICVCLIQHPRQIAHTGLCLECYISDASHTNLSRAWHPGELQYRPLPV
jgi:hypothetical protein